MKAVVGSRGPLAPLRVAQRPRAVPQDGTRRTADQYARGSSMRVPGGCRLRAAAKEVTEVTDLDQQPDNRIPVTVGANPPHLTEMAG
jgi:hypothetical protein